MDNIEFEIDILNKKLKDTCIFIQQIFHAQIQKNYKIGDNQSRSSLLLIIHQIRNDSGYFTVWKNAVELQYPKLLKWFKRIIHLSLFKIYGDEFKLHTYSCNIPIWKPLYNHFLKVYYVDTSCFSISNYTKCIVYFQRSWDSFIAVNIPLRLEVPFDQMIFNKKKMTSCVDQDDHKHKTYPKVLEQPVRKVKPTGSIMRLQIPNELNDT